MKKEYIKPEIYFEEIVMDDIICTSSSEDLTFGVTPDDVWNFGSK